MNEHSVDHTEGRSHLKHDAPSEVMHEDVDDSGRGERRMYRPW